MVSHRHNAPPGAGRAARATVLTAAAASAAAMAAAPAGADPDRPTAASVDAKVERLYAEAERATEKYNASQTAVTDLRRRVAHTQDEVARGQARVNRLRNALGALAGAQYRSGALDPTVALLLSSDPDGYLGKAAAMERVSSRKLGELRELRGAQRLLDAKRERARGQLQRLEKENERLRRHKRAVQSKLGAARRLLNSLSAAERREREERASRSGTRSGAAPTAVGTGRWGAALAAARSALGRPYAWGQSGPGAFDCAGLTQWAYRQAGVSIPRTSQGQAYAGRRVPLSEARPGDLVIYRGDASHVAMYAGGGQVIHAPYPGARVRYDPVGMMPVSGVTRP
ncbi:NlpC/P60 family protein [Streptomyces sp. JJ38]|uniref:C40 family peptidase n=1 Tax=Streptomyces sp. JJ38 TaxID=2738128 RepID=UPI0027DEB2A6|nr:NlpC/P60 family protein [Streptomyces sp. JJ38]